MNANYLLKLHKESMNEELEQISKRLKIHTITDDKLGRTLTNTQKETLENYILIKFNRLFSNENDYDSKINEKIDIYLKELERATKIDKYPYRIKEILNGEPINEVYIKQKYIDTINFAINNFNQIMMFYVLTSKK